MRTTSVKTMLAIAAVCLMGGALQAQEEHKINARVPFDFQLDSKVLPAGDYTFVNSPLKPSAEVLNRQTGKRNFVLAAYGKENSSNRTSVVFHRYGSTYFLSQIWTGVSGGGTLPVSRREKELMNSPQGVAMAVVSIAVRAD